MSKLLSIPLVFLVCAMPVDLYAATTNLSPTSQSPATPAEHTELIVAINRLATALEIQHRDTNELKTSAKLDQAIAYLNFRSRRLENLEKDAVTTRQLRTAQEDLLKIRDDRIRELERQIRDCPKNTVVSDLELQCTTEKTQKNMIKQRITRMDDELVQLDNQIYELRNELDKLETYVRNNLDFQ